MNNNLNELISIALLQLEEKGYSSKTIRGYAISYSLLSRYCVENKIAHYTDAVGNKFIEEFEKRVNPLNTATIAAYKRHICKLTSPLETINPPHVGRTPKYYAASCYDQTVDVYEEYLYKTGKTKKDVRSRTHIVSRFLKYLDDNGCFSLKDITPKDIYGAFNECTDKNSFRRLVGAFLQYANKYSLTSFNLYPYVPSPVRHKPIPTVYSKDEVERLLLSIDRKTAKGKRDYAIVLIAARLGLRASDIAGLTFNCICESTSTIKLVQRKTKKTIQLPLLNELKKAIHDYVKQARPKSNNDHVFLHCDGAKSVSSENIGKIVELSLLNSGVNCSNKRKGSHSLRASLATALLDEGNDYSTIQKVLGQSELESTKSYVKVNIEQLRINALNVHLPMGDFKNLLMGGENQ